MAEFGKLKFNEEIYRILNTFPLKKPYVNQVAKDWRKIGYYVRVVRRGRGGKDYYLFGRKK